MVELVVLDVPRLDEHPVEPVGAAAVEVPDAKLEAVELAVLAVVEAAVAHVVRDDRPPRHRADRDQIDGDRVDAVPHGEAAKPDAETLPPDNLAQVRQIGLALLVVQGLP